MIISLHHSDPIPDEVVRLNEPRTALDAFEWYVDQENIYDHRQFTVDRDAFRAQWSSWSDEMQSEQFLVSTTLSYRMKHIMGSLCAHLCRARVVIVDDQAGYVVEDRVRVRQNFIAKYPSLYFATYFCLSNYNLATITMPTQSQTPGIEPLQVLLKKYGSDPDHARSVISDLHTFVMLREVR